MTAQLLLSLSILVVVHEWGHYITARMFKIRVEKFYLFFDFLFPLANVMNFSLIKFKRGDTLFGVGWFPLGGYVKIAGMVDESMDKEQMKSAPEPWEFRSKPAWQRLIVMLGGIIVNVIVGVLIFVAITYWLGDSYIRKDYVNAHGGIQALALADSIGLKTGDKIVRINGHDYTDFADIAKPDVLLSDSATYTVDRNGQEVTIHLPANFIENFNRRNAASMFAIPRVLAQVNSIREGSLAGKLGLQKDDKFISVNGSDVTYFDEVAAAVKSTQSDSIRFSVLRGADTLQFAGPLGNDRTIGFYVSKMPVEGITVTRYSLGQSFAMGPARAFGVIYNQLKAFRKMFKGNLSFRKSLSGPVGMAQMYGGEWDWQRFWQMTGILSMVLAFMNLLPIPALDGGYVVFLLWEMITGKEPSEKFFENALKVGFALIILLMVFVFSNDIIKQFTGN